MRRGTIVGIVIVAVLVTGVGAAAAVSLTGRGDEAAAPSPTITATQSQAAGPTQTPAPSPSPAPSASPSPSPGMYVEYSEAALAAATGERVLFFHAPWCPQCRALEADIVANGVPPGWTILVVDYDSNQQLRQRYGVTLQTTLVALDDQGEATTTFVAYDDPTVAAVVAGLNLAG